jgi:ureidoglycolate lyase
MSKADTIALRPGPLTQEAFAPFGQVIMRPDGVGQRLDAGTLENRRPHARPTLRISMSAPVELPVVARAMERHRFSSQSFVPIDISRFLVVVAPHAADGSGPDMTQAHSFIFRGDQGVHYNADTWHYQMSPLDRPATYAVLMWRDGTADDIETITLPTPVTIVET